MAFRAIALWNLLVLITFGLSSCGAEGVSAEKMLRPSSEASAASDARRVADSSAAGEATRAKAQSRERILRSTLFLRVKDCEGFAKAAKDLVRDLGGHLDQERLGLLATAREATLILRVPSAQHEEALLRLKALGEPLRLDTEVIDVFDRLVDLKARLKTQEALEARFLAYLEPEAAPGAAEAANAKALDLEAILAVERELARVREEIEVLTGKLRQVESEVAQSRIEIRATEDPQRLAEASQKGLDVRAASAWQRSLQSLRTTGERILIGLVALVPWSPLLFGLAFGLSRAFRGRLKTKRPATPADKD